MPPSEGDNAEERDATLQAHCGAAFQVAQKIAKLFAVRRTALQPKKRPADMMRRISRRRRTSRRITAIGCPIAIFSSGRSPAFRRRRRRISRRGSLFSRHRFSNRRRRRRHALRRLHLRRGPDDLGPRGRRLCWDPRAAAAHAVADTIRRISRRSRISRRITAIGSYALRRRRRRISRRGSLFSRRRSSRRRRRRRHALLKCAVAKECTVRIFWRP
jgi:hypothetical protein